MWRGYWNAVRRLSATIYLRRTEISLCSSIGRGKSTGREAEEPDRILIVGVPIWLREKSCIDLGQVLLKFPRVPARENSMHSGRSRLNGVAGYTLTHSIMQQTSIVLKAWSRGLNFCSFGLTTCLRIGLILFKIALDARRGSGVCARSF